MTEKWLSEIAPEITVDSLPESYQILAEVIGLENTLKASTVLGGLLYYFKKIDKLLLEKRDILIKREFDGINYKDLARKYGLSERQIREIVRNKSTQKQTDLF
jgi:Mor family transcriptional regulator